MAIYLCPKCDQFIDDDYFPMEEDGVCPDCAEEKEMGTNLIDVMTEREAKHLLNDIANVFSIGGKARTSQTILTNVRNAVRRADCLSRVESYMTKTEIDEDGEEVENNLLRWGDIPEDYIERFKEIVALTPQEGKDG